MLSFEDGREVLSASAAPAHIEELRCKLTSINR
jgi:hypothetical protein